ncbi:polyprenyl synthetase family protein [Oscillospiraceae bacterium OttesenSCG-928-G22]|nr:polyprenyl synthetase family protein [Oscillospiraceae bacterium OttesenSCG-928-G22]
MDYEKKYEDYIAKIDEALTYYIPNIPVAQAELFDAIHYSLFPGGKRIRPVLFMEVYRVLGGAPEEAMAFPAAIEMIHTYSLIHDDLPSMDDDEVRRGRPTSHMIFGEATALLAGDALLNAAFETITDEENISHLDPARVLRAVHAIAWASGAYGMAGGQMLDLNFNAFGSSIKELTAIHRLKTGALISSAAASAAALAGASEAESDAVISFAQNIGLAFQIMDDLLDFGEQPADGGTSPEPSFVALLGPEDCKRAVDHLTEQAKRDLAGLSDTGFLLWISDYLSKRTH